MRFAFKAVVVFFLTLGLLIPLLLIRGTIQEREVYRAEAVANVAATSAGKQAVLGPVLVVPYTELVEQDEVTPQGVRKVLKEQAGKWTFFPDTLVVDGTMKPDTRKRGLYRVPVYELDMHAVAAIRAQIPVDGARPRRIGRPFLSVGASDVRGFVGTPTLKVGGRALPLTAGFGSQPIGGVHARMDAPQAGQAIALDVTFDAVIGGTEALALVPIARDNRFALKSTWPDPIFGGSFLPRTRTVDAKGFRAQWEISSLATSAQTRFLETKDPTSLLQLAPMRGSDASVSGVDAVGVTLFDAVDSYTLADRATKYGILFVLLTFVGFFMFELIKQLPIHPIQYGLVGLALAIFFLLLVSLSEHIPFGSAYLVSAAACIGLLGFYLSAVLQSVLRGVGFAAMLALLYAALYGVLVSEDNALVLGAGLLFVVLATIMVVTRKVDWYALQR
ncbi:cell envelope integrity protein CreD [Noviluteimonas gilva]|uniref:Cell envelope integrity protein CreD n=1 Tax=Noviluteimonas gilva TaxID=2682097 RepID=A0A7C9HSL4_9GAMM|nr:cell envelope integrity protein CreD [Lysobacter gilvus]MUV14171.1 cell envelope integrity protein CreD [Lysobacter gilvus]